MINLHEFAHLAIKHHIIFSSDLKGNITFTLIRNGVAEDLATVPSAIAYDTLCELIEKGGRQ